MSSRNLEGRHFGVTRELRNQYDEAHSSGIPPEQLERIQARVRELLPALMAWRECYPAIAASRLKAATLGCVATDPGATLAQHLLISQVGLLVFAVDDVADGEIGSLPDEALHAVLERYARTARAPESETWPGSGSGSGEADSIGGAVWDVARALQALPGAGRFLALWREHFERMCAAHSTALRDQRHFQRDGTLPSLEHYLDMSRWTCGAPMYHAAGLVVLGPDYAGEPLQEPLIERVLSEMAWLGRWMNDVRSLERERAEGGFNGLSLLMAAGLSEAEAERSAVERAGQHLENLKQLVGQLPESLRHWGGTLVATGHFSRMFYLQREFHHAE
ncbi:terpene synthase family protein [Archangium sp.]|uniref:terpene synthase family protein n=1 Tax=Archangium sp. TaxID=1872627 RepID=UPI003899D4B7